MFVGCRKCKGTGYIYSTNSVGEEVVTTCSCYKKYLNNAKQNLYLKSRGIDTDFTLDDYVGPSEVKDKLKTLVQSFEDFVGHSFYFYGPMSTQKTTMAKALAKELHKIKGTDVFYTFMNTLVQKSVELTSLDDKEKIEEIESYKERILEVPLLIIDECFMKDRVLVYRSGFQIPHLDTFLRERLETRKDTVTILISNIAVEDIDESVFNPYLKELVRRNCYPLEFTQSMKGHDNVVENLFNRKLHA